MSRQKKRNTTPKTPVVKRATDSDEEISVEVAEVIKQLPKENRQLLIQALSVKNHYSGPLPDGKNIKIYSEVIPDGGDRLMKTVETQ